MTSHLDRSLTQSEIERLSSPYLRGGRKQEGWQIDSIHISGRQLDARVSMLGTYISATDSLGFHLTIFSALEFTSQLMIIYAHAWAGLTEKSREAWMLESSTRSVRAIRKPEQIRVEMQVSQIRRRGHNLYCQATYEITDDTGGLFEIRLKGFLA